MRQPVRSPVRLLPILSIVVSGITVAAPADESIDVVVERAMQVFDVPGMAVSVVHEGEVVYSAGRGIVETGATGKVDDRTLFRIGSVSKAFTAATLAILADEGKLSWDDRVIDHIPEFRMHDPWVTREFTIRDLLTHRSGLPLGAGDLLMFPDGNATVTEIVHALRYLQPSSSFRSKFDYDNLLYIIAGEVTARVSGMAYEDFLEQRLLEPIGMSDCVAAAGRASKRAVLATPHVLVDGNLETTTTRIGRSVSAAGGITCSARSMARWMQFILDEGASADGKKLISEAQFAQLVAPVTLLPVPGYLAEHAGAYLSAYALGWGVSTFYGEPILSHGGGVWGMTTFIAVMPEQELAVFATNNLMSVAPRAVVNAVIDLFLEDESPDAGIDWIEIFDAAIQDRRSAANDVVAEAWASRAADSEPSLPLESYTGAYRDDWYGSISISLQDGRLWFRSERNPPLQGPLEHFQYDTFIARWTDRRLDADAYVTFALDPDGKVERIRMKAVSPATDFSYDFHDLDLLRIASD